jgi:competence protein ComEA
MLRKAREASSRLVARVAGSRFAKPIARVTLAAAGLLLLAFIGKTAVAGAMATGTSPGAPSAVASYASPLLAAAATPSPVAETPVPPAPAAPASAPAPDPAPTSASHARATPDDPVILNTATVDDLRRLPGIGEKRATAALALRTRLGGRFHAIEDLLKVKGVGRTTLRHLRPLVRLDPPAVPEAGAEAPR